MGHCEHRTKARCQEMKYNTTRKVVNCPVLAAIAAEGAKAKPRGVDEHEVVMTFPRFHR